LLSSNGVTILAQGDVNLVRMKALKAVRPGSYSGTVRLAR